MLGKQGTRENHGQEIRPKERMPSKGEKQEKGLGIMVRQMDHTEWPQNETPKEIKKNNIESKLANALVH